MSDERVSAELRRFGGNLRRIRVAGHMTQERLAELAELNTRTLQKIEAGKTNILITTAMRLRDALECDWDDLMEPGRDRKPGRPAE